MNFQGPLGRTYYRLPATVQNAVCSAYGWSESRTRFSASFDARLSWLIETDAWSRGRIREYQDEQVARLIEHAYRYVPYYRDLMDRRGLRPTHIASVADLQSLPVLTKDDVRRNRERLVSTASKRRNLIERHTSGSTGSPLTTLASSDAVAFQWAVWWRHRHRFGVRPGDVHANFTGMPVVPPNQASAPYWRWNHAFRQALIPMQQIVPEKIRTIHLFLEEHSFQFYSGYPSIMYSLAVQATEAGLTLDRGPRVIFTGAERVQPFQQNALESYSGARVSQQYGFSEGAANAAQCEYSAYHEDFEFGVMEVLDGVSDPNTGGSSGTIVATGFSNPAFPLIRYKVGDTATWHPRDYACPCGRNSQVLASIDGRTEEYVTTPDGHRVMRFDYVFKDMWNVRYAQIVQTDPESIVVRVVPTRRFSAADEGILRASIASWISPRLAVSIELVDSIPLGPNGKFQAVLRLDNPQ